MLGKNPTNLKTHLRSCSPEKLQKVEEDEVAAKEARLSSITTVRKPLVNVLYPDIVTAADEGDTNKKGKRKYPQNWTEDSQKQADRLLALFIGGSTIPVSVTDDLNLRRFISNIAPMVS